MTESILLNLRGVTSLGVRVRFNLDTPLQMVLTRVHLVIRGVLVGLGGILEMIQN